LSKVKLDGLSKEDLKKLRQLKAAIDKLPKKERRAIAKKLKGLDEEGLEEEGKKLYGRLVAGKKGEKKLIELEADKKKGPKKGGKKGGKGVQSLT